jgi:hypothetical protein
MTMWLWLWPPLRDCHVQGLSLYLLFLILSHNSKLQHYNLSHKGGLQPELWLKKGFSGFKGTVSGDF